MDGLTSKNYRAKRLVGLRDVSKNDKSEVVCPICGESLNLSEYNYFLWCPKCDLDIPEILCDNEVYCQSDLVERDGIEERTEKFLDIIENTKVNPSFKKFMEDERALRNLAYAIISLLGQSDGEMDFRTFRFALFKLYNDLKDQGIDIKLPYYWYIDGPHIYLRGLPAVFKLKLIREGKMFRVRAVLDRRIIIKVSKND